MAFTLHVLRHSFAATAVWNVLSRAGHRWRDRLFTSWNYGRVMLMFRMRPEKSNFEPDADAVSGGKRIIEPAQVVHSHTLSVLATNQKSYLPPEAAHALQRVAHLLSPLEAGVGASNPAKKFVWRA